MTLAQLRDISVVWLSLLCFIGMLIPLAVTYFAVRGMNHVLDKTPGAMRRAQGISRAARDRTLAVSNQVAEPLIRTQGAVVRTQATARAILADEPKPSSSTESRHEP
jgi:hypothetical protein